MSEAARSHETPFSLIASREIPPAARAPAPNAPRFSQRLSHYVDCRRGNLLTHLQLAKLDWIERFRPTRHLKILFSRMPDWESSLRAAFHGIGHEIEFGSFTEDSVRRHQLLVPLTIDDTLQLDAMREHLGANPIPIPSATAVEICNNKEHFYQALAAKGFGELLPGPRHAGSYPYVLKKKVDAWGKYCLVIRDAHDEAEQGHHLADPDYLTQRFISGNEEFATHVLIRDGRMLASLNIRYRFAETTPIKGKSRAVTIHPCSFPYERLFGEILRAIGFEGLCCFNYKVVGGGPRILEINPRFGGSLGPFFPSFVRAAAR